MPLDLIPFVTIPGLYLVAALIKPLVKSKLPFNLCAICIAVSLTWLGLLIAWFLGENISTTTLAILMGMSLTGIMYKLEVLYKEYRLRHFWWVRLVIIIGGFASVYFLLNTREDIFLLAAIVSLFAILIPTFLMQKESTKHQSSITKKLDDCC